MSWRTFRQAVAAMRREISYRGGGTIRIHRATCGLNAGGGHDCQTRRVLVRARAA